VAPVVVRLLRARWLDSPGKGPDDFVFTNSVGRPLDCRKVGRAFRLGVQRSGVPGDGRLSLHSLRHGYASLLIADGLDVVFVSRQLGHADPGVTLSVHPFCSPGPSMRWRPARRSRRATRRSRSVGRSRAGPPREEPRW